MNVLSCLLCENVHPEGNGKMSLLGFYGILPNVSIYIQYLDRPVAMLIFLFTFSEGIGEQSFSGRLTNESGLEIMKTPGDVKVLFQAGAQVSLGMGFQNVVFKKAGSYTVELINAGRAVHSATFKVFPGPIPTFQP